MLRASWILYTTHLWRTLLSRRALLCLILVLVPIAPALLIASMQREWGEPPALILLWALQLQLVVPLVSLLLGSAVVAEEVEDRTITYLFTRPIPRASLLFGRWAAAVTVALLLVSASSWFVIQILAGAASGDPKVALDGAAQLRVFQTILLGTTSYTLLFAVLGTLVKHPVILGLGYTFAIEGFLANLPGSGQGITILHHLKSFLAGGDTALQDRMEQLAATTLYEPSQALVRLAVACLALAVFGAWTVTRKQYVLPS